MPRHSKAFLRRSAAARKGWRTRRRHEREHEAELEKRRKRRKKKREITPPPVEEYVDVIGIDSLYED